MTFPLQEYEWPGIEGSFAAVRKHDIHTGIDLYCKPGSRVLAIESGIVVAVENFTGPKAGSPWWNDTQAVLVEGKSGVVCYGEIDTSLSVGDVVQEKSLIGEVITVLKKDKGKPMTMLHLELYEHGITESVIWELESKKPKGLLDPTGLLISHRKENS